MPGTDYKGLTVPDTNPSGAAGLAIMNNFKTIADRIDNKNFHIGSYTGDGTTTNAVSGLGFQPDFILILEEDSGHTNGAYIGFRGMSDNDDLYHTAGSSHITGAIQWDSDGFTLTTSDAAINTDTTTYFFLAVKAQ